MPRVHLPQNQIGTRPCRKNRRCHRRRHPMHRSRGHLLQPRGFEHGRNHDNATQARHRLPLRQRTRVGSRWEASRHAQGIGKLSHHDVQCHIRIRKDGGTKRILLLHGRGTRKARGERTKVVGRTVSGRGGFQTQRVQGGRELRDDQSEGHRSVIVGYLCQGGHLVLAPCEAQEHGTVDVGVRRIAHPFCGGFGRDTIGLGREGERGLVGR
mmetsp:Transcript_16903/g.35747  ORF Transcript_16903/g.35747 Transcript_16903/m.35747 type:complete len:211 (-) Transcript_16903:657-1289(-)